MIFIEPFPRYGDLKSIKIWEILKYRLGVEMEFMGYETIRTSEEEPSEILVPRSKNFYVCKPK